MRYSRGDARRPLAKRQSFPTSVLPSRSAQLEDASRHGWLAWTLLIKSIHAARMGTERARSLRCRHRQATRYTISR